MSNSTVLVVGGAGYIGSHMVNALLGAGHRVVVLDDLSRGHRDLVPGGTFIEGDLGDRPVLEDIFDTHRIDAVMHFAALSLVGESVEKPLLYYQNNVAKTLTLIQQMDLFGVDKFIFSSTAAVYGESGDGPIDEGRRCDPVNPYGVTKMVIERVLQDCSRSQGIKSVCLRYFNAAGADESGRLGERHEPETHLIPIILQVAAGIRDQVKIFGTDYPTPDGTCIRDYVHVNDLAQAHLLALDSLLAGGQSRIYNLGNSRGRSVREVVDTARAVTGHAIPCIEAPRRAGDPAVLVADSRKIREELGWKPRYEDLTTIIATAWQWHQREMGSAAARVK